MLQFKRAKNEQMQGSLETVSMQMLAATLKSQIGFAHDDDDDDEYFKSSFQPVRAHRCLGAHLSKLAPIS